MKKTIILFYLFMLLLANNTTLNANQILDVTKPLICLEGVNYSDYLNYDGYKIVQNNVNFNVAGKYQVIYENNSNEQFIKNVDVIDKENLNDLTYYQIINNEFDNNNQYYWEGIYAELELDEYQYQIVSYFDPDNETSIEYFNIYYNKNLIKQSILSENADIKIKKIIKTENNLYLIGIRRTTNSSYDLYVAEYTLYAEFIRDFSIHGNKYDEVSDAIIIDDYMYVIGITSSNDGYYSNTFDNDLYIFKIDYKLGIIRKSYTSSKEGSETATNFVYINDNLYYGYSYIKNGYKNQVVRKIDLNLTELSEIDYGYRIGIDIKKLSTDDNNLYILMSYHDYDLKRAIAVLKVVNHNFAYVDQYTYKYPNYSYIKPLDIVINNDNVISILFQVNSNNYIPGYSIIKLKDKTEILNIINIDNEYPFRFKNNNGNTIYTSKNNKLFIKQINSIIVKDFGPTEITNDKNIKDYVVYINSNKVQYDKEKSTINYNLDIFGNYNLTYYFNTNDVDFIYTKTCYVKENINILNNETYDKNFRIYFNAIGYLNGELIQSGYQIVNPGKYTLDLIGNDSIQRKYTFYIEDNSCKNIYQDEEVNILIEEEEMYSDDENIYIDVNHIKNSSDTNDVESNYLMLIPIIIFTATLLCFFKIK